MNSESQSSRRQLIAKNSCTVTTLHCYCFCARPDIRSLPTSRPSGVDPTRNVSEGRSPLALLSSLTASQAFEFNPLTPNDLYMSRTAQLTSKRCILYIYSTNVGTEYFKHALYSPFFSSSKCSLLHNASLFGSCIIHILHAGCA